MTTSAPITERRYVAPLILVTTLFFLWALGVNLNDVLIPHLKKVFDLNDFQSALIQVAFFGRYCLSALPAGRRSEEHTSELQSRLHLVCRLLLEKKKKIRNNIREILSVTN